MSKILSYHKIQQRYDGEWVSISYEILDENLKPIAGEVIAHSIDLDEVYAALGKQGSRRVAIECFANIPEYGIHYFIQ